ncbi:hypothetical protein [uncultured Nocardioides sp.]|uniref:Bacteriocin biosynthesis cyclodehydratase domain-containing protein n=1 Tax=uncultured Nocardioides sp. TaxID=198441 RepID=A0A6J4MXV9_9ACTN|nr:hypothetical protein [uncultured Nocardioides sp.]CAA9372144.1 MAG: hypothetical protein AVDCRST_MAG06-151 [uncultured Nocardioides sp.]
MHDIESLRWVRLRAGVPVVRRDDRHLQVGSHPQWRVVVPATPAFGALLRRLARGLDPSLLPGDEASLVADLADARLLVAPGERDRRLLRRSRTLVGLAGPEVWLGELAGRLSDAGVRSVEGADEEADVAVVISAGEPDREAGDRCLRADQPTLFVAAVDGRVLVGPFVVPGSTACLQCLDAHARDRDARHPVLVEQWSGGAQPVEVEASLMSLALAWACDDVVRWCHAARPTTWSATVRLDEEAAPQVLTWAPHPWCGCGWSGLDVPG